MSEHEPLDHQGHTLQLTCEQFLALHALVSEHHLAHMLQVTKDKDLIRDRTYVDELCVEQRAARTFP